MAVGPALTDSAELRASIGLPLTFAFGGILLFPLPERRFVLARSIVVDERLIGLHAAVHRAAPGAIDQTTPGAWTPHVTLSRRLTTAQVAVALDVLRAMPTGSFAGARLWDGERKSIIDLTP